MSTESNINVVPMAMKPSASIVMVTPDTAARWLAANTINRNLRPQLVAAYARDMAAGSWKITGESIKFDTTGRLLDGQHRLAAAVKSGATIGFFVVRGLQPDAQLVMDTGAKRTTADALNLLGRSASTAAAAGGRLAIRLSQGTADSNDRERITTSEILRWVDNNPDFEFAAQQCTGRFSRVNLPKAVLTYGYWRLMRIDPYLADEFFRQVQEPDAIPAADPRAVLHRRLMQMKLQRTVETHLAYLDLVFQAWNRHRAGKNATLFRVIRHGNRVVLTEPK